MTMLYLVRHGETIANTQRRYIGWEDPPLSPAGEAQAGALAARLPGTIPAVYSSDLQRARRTAEILAQPLGLPVQADPCLRELNFGAFSGLTYAEIAARHPAELRAWIAHPDRHAPPGGESLTTLTDRLLQSFPRQQGALIVTHGGPIRALVSHFTGRPFWEIEVPHCTLILLEVPCHS